MKKMLFGMSYDKGLRRDIYTRTDLPTTMYRIFDHHVARGSVDLFQHSWNHDRKAVRCLLLFLQPPGCYYIGIKCWMPGHGLAAYQS